MNRTLLREQLTQFLNEDIGFGDASSALIDPIDVATAVVTAKADGVFAGLDVVMELAAMQRLVVEQCRDDGTDLKKGDVMFALRGKTRTILETERILLNLVQHMCGIATLTRRCVEALADSSIRVTDTRKTTPGLRMLEKYAVRCGGGYNHRLRLDDAVMIKDNHIAALGGITRAIETARAQNGHTTPIEVEVETIEQLREAIAASPDIIMLDNRSSEELKAWVALVPSHITTEASGGITVDTIAAYRGTGVDVISIGQLTHSVTALDCSLNLKGGVKHAVTRNDASAIR
ncbi:carboxylating nicotinate-nucleotide diphosphorylase [Exiguobacterium sp. SH3S2]|uniref:carboxylating nicotinate-nucleotide diphosphorylase n=1 Tax=unclassified Exiguobacterium TaxID=2644629 RepID=UPI001039D516|nr:MULTISPECIES: carboxylating nicotinate-nucleotide diphosphorylase [unclassified Exiguobacterium]TCI43322.1 carboxylating nicotinate-nucleotide diphosphorylase [Exiguobacterium sp. SH3S3]TCI59168.1 carboxylating nicotinate-nucleotide diphosphorylase [Exiguobacterium sp. SH3S2]